MSQTVKTIESSNLVPQLFTPFVNRRETCGWFVLQCYNVLDVQTFEDNNMTSCRVDLMRPFSIIGHIQKSHVYLFHLESFVIIFDSVNFPLFTNLMILCPAIAPNIK